MIAAASIHAEAAALCEAAETHIRQGRISTAIACLRQSLALDPGQHGAHRRIWNLHGQCGNLQPAIDAFRKALTDRFRREPLPEAARQRRRIERTTLCAVDCLYPELTIPALLRSMAECQFDAVKLFTDQQVKVPGIEVVRIAPITSLQQYSQFMVKDLAPHIDTDHLLSIQWDGFVCNAEHWDSTFLLHDYIGARWPLEVLFDRPDQAVGNGGFSLRSRALLEALQDPKIDTVHPEDAVICRRYRPYLEQRYGIVFADDATADRFSSEHCAQDTPTFGFHGIINLSRHLPWPEFQRFEFFE